MHVISLPVVSLGFQAKPYISSKVTLLIQATSKHPSKVEHGFQAKSTTPQRIRNNPSNVSKPQEIRSQVSVRTKSNAQTPRETRRAPTAPPGTHGPAGPAALPPRFGPPSRRKSTRLFAELVYACRVRLRARPRVCVLAVRALARVHVGA